MKKLILFLLLFCFGINLFSQTTPTFVPQGAGYGTINVAGTEYSATANGYGWAAGRSAIALPVAQDWYIQYRLTNVAAQGISIFGIETASGDGAPAGWNVACYQNFSNVVPTVLLVDQTSTSGLSTGNYVRIQKTGSTIKMRTSTDGSTFTDRYTYAFTQTVTMYPAVYMYGYSTFSTPLVFVASGGNASPVSFAGVDSTVLLPTTTITISGYGTDSDGSISAYSWSKVSGPSSGTVTTTNSHTSTVTGLVPGVYVFRLTVTDNGGASSFDERTITVNNPTGGTSSVVNAGADQSITVGSTLNLSGTAYDPTVTPTTNLILIWGESNPAGAVLSSTSGMAASDSGLHARVNILSNDIYSTDYTFGAFHDLRIGYNDNVNNGVGVRAGNNNVDNYAGLNSEQHGFEVGLAKEVEADRLGTGDVYLVKAAKSGGRIGDYLAAGGDGWRDKLQLRMDSAVAKLTRAGIAHKITVWASIGLNDQANSLAGATFVTNVQSFQAWFRARYGASVEFIFTKFYDDGVSSPPAHPYNPFIQQLDDADTKTYSISAQGATHYDANVHWDDAGLKVMATRFVTQMISNQGSTLPVTTAWTKTAGPAGGTITTASALNTTVTGLPSGVHTFRLTSTTSGGVVTFDEMNATVTNNIQGSNISFTPIPFTDVDIIAPFRGAEIWYNEYLVQSPTGTGTNAPPQGSGAVTTLNQYWRFPWRAIQNDDGTYSWTMIDSLFKQAIRNKRKIGIGIMQLGGSFGASTVAGKYLTYPLFLHTQMQGEANPDYADGAGYPGYDQWYPNVNSNFYQTAWANMLLAVANRINTTSWLGVLYKDALQYVDIRGHGFYGEWNGYNATTKPAGMSSALIATPANLIKIVDAAKAAFPDVQLVAPIGAYYGDQGSDSGSPPEVGYYIITTSNAFGKIGIRRDHWGQNSAWMPGFFENNNTTYNGIVFKDSLMARWKSAPIIGEPSAADVGGGGGGDGPVPYYDLPRQVRLYHGTSFGNGNYGGYNVTGTLQLRDSVRLAHKLTGYRIVPSGGTMTSTLTANSLMTINMDWRNVGLAPLYDAWDIWFELRDISGVVRWSGKSSFNLRLFLPQTNATAHIDNFTLPNISGGGYSLVMIIKDPKNYVAPLPLAITGRQSDGSYVMRTGITIQAGGVVNQPPSVSAGSDKSITLPVNSVQLDGTGSDVDGSVSTITWTKLSGPAGGTLTNSGIFSTTATGLLAGNYVYRLTVTDNQGASSIDDMQVIVNSQAVNQPPTVSAGADSTILFPQNTVNLLGSGLDFDGTIVSYNWALLSGPTGTGIISPTSPNTVVSFINPGNYVFRLTVTDNQNATASDNVQVFVNSLEVNLPPVSNAGTDQTITTALGQVTLTGSGSYDTDGFISSYTWSKIAGPIGGTLATPNNVTTLANGLIAGNYTFRLLVVDNLGINHTDDVIVNVNPSTQLRPKYRIRYRVKN